jgi:NADPH-dependent 2,4-dienoyl-CoA reductase/sulfur reductase-like enzyme
MKKAKRVIVVGAGPIGVEIGLSLRNFGVEIVIIELLERILSGILDPIASEIVTQYLEDFGITILLGKSISEILGKDRVTNINLENEEIDCDLLIFSTGINPNIDLVKTSRIGINQGIEVDEEMRTSENNIYAAGDVAEGFNFFGERLLIPTWPNAVSQGRVAGYNMVDKNVNHDGSVRVNIIKDAPIPIVSLGYTATSLGGQKFYQVEYRSKKIYKKGIFIHDNLVGFQSIGSYKAIEMSGLLQNIIFKKIPIDKKDSILREDLTLNKLYYGNSLFLK